MTATSTAPDPRRTVLRVIVVTLLVLALTTAVTVMVAYQRLDENVLPGAPIPDQEPKPKAVGGEPLNIVVMGSDSREGAGNDIDSDTSTGRRSDTTILVHVSGDRKEVYGVSLPRDALVTRPDCEGPDGETVPGGELEMFNSAFSVGGEACTVQMIHELTGVYIDHYISVDFNGFKKMVDAVKGVTVCIPEDVDDPKTGISFDAGTQELDGQQALDYVRERSQLSANADIGRMKRQQAFVASMINKVISAGTLTRPFRVYEFVEAATESITPDPDLASLDKLAKLARQFRETNLDDIEFITVPFMEYEPDPNRLVWAPQADELWARIIADKPLNKKLSGEVVTASDPVGPSSPGDGSSESPSASGTPGGDVEATATENGLCA
ncbi:LCP family protein [Nocardioides sp.]|uniref:LCP family protein n=1 Tax=Nocardioides sp. TaxID=35761 RepID=UPI001A1B3E51|nr:LCP family protein [Nocardioides sp.]MBJ7356639.1 LCP family protein [Nocardioides sp.]